MALEDEPLGRVRDVVRGDGRVVRDLLDDEVGAAPAGDVGPGAIKQPTRHISVSSTLTFKEERARGEGEGGGREGGEGRDLLAEDGVQRSLQRDA